MHYSTFGKKELSGQDAISPWHFANRRARATIVYPSLYNPDFAPPRDPKTANYLPHPAAEGSPHTTLGVRDGSNRRYTQGATFDEIGEFQGRTDVTDHGRKDHPNPLSSSYFSKWCKKGPHDFPIT